MQTIRNLWRAVAIVAVVLALPLAVVAQSATPAASPTASDIGQLPPAWLEFGPGGQLLARVIAADTCPAITLDGSESVMQPRSLPTAEFPVLGCEATVPFGVTTASINGVALPLPQGKVERIAVIGDTGCRLNAWEKKFQDCNDPTAWPFAQVAASVAAWQPDLVVHVGDYLYRESPCPAEMSGCAGSPSGDTWVTWNADFFTPASPLLGSAPWLFMRGNHETCDRNPQGWFRFLEPRAYSEICRTYTEPYLAVVNGITFAVVDSAEASDEKTSPEEDAEYVREFNALDAMAPPGSWLVTHRPIWGILDLHSSDQQVENATFHEAIEASLEPTYALILSGHIHSAEMIDFAAASQRPPQIITGNSGTALDTIIPGTPIPGSLGDVEIEEAEAFSAFGFMTIEPDGASWQATQRDASGAPLTICTLDLPAFSCQSA